MFLYKKLQERVDAAAAGTLLLNETRVRLREAQVGYLVAAQQITDLLLSSDRGDGFNERKRQEQKARENATINVETAFAATQDAELKELLLKLINHNRHVILPLKDEVLRLAASDLHAAQNLYWFKYLPAQVEKMAFINEAISLSTSELGAFHMQADEAAADAQFVARITVILSAFLGLGIVFFLGIALTRFMIYTGRTARENKNLMDNSLDVICSIDESGCFIQVSNACQRAWGYTADELKGRSYIALLHPADVDRTAQAAARIMSGNPVLNFDNRYIHKDGSIVHNRWSVQWSSDQRQMFCVAHDVSEVNRVSEALQASEERTRLILGAANDAFIGMDSKGIIIDWNQQAEAIFGWSSEEARGRLFQELVIAPSGWTMYLETLKQLEPMSGSLTANRRFELIALHRGSREFPIEISVSLIRRGESFMLSAFLRDIAERKQWETELNQAKETAEAATFAKSTFLANMSHEIRTPMNGIIGLTNLTLKTPLSPQQHEFMTLIKSSANSLLRLLNDILDFSKMEASKLELDEIEFDLRGLAGNTLKAFSASANEKGIELTYQVNPEVPFLLKGDPGRIAQIIVNLTGNALKFTDSGEVVLRVAQESQQGSSIQHAMLHFSITDTGIGMSAEQQAHIFTAFAQGDNSTTRQYGGTGLGLTIVSQLVTLMGGSIWVESELGKGTTVHFTAKLAIPEHQPEPARLPNLNNMRVLVADDNSSNRVILEEILRSWSMQPTLAKDGKEAFAELRHMAALGEPYPLVLLDSLMPEYGGFELAQLIKDTPCLAGTTILMLSSSDVSKEVRDCEALGVVRCLRKPIKQSELFDAIIAGISGADDGTIPMPNLQPGLSKTLRVLNVLVAEDHPINQMVVVEILRDRGHAFSTANNGIEVLQMLDQQSYDAILMDCQMPQMDGYEAAAEIRKREKNTGKHIRIIALTANAMKDDRERCLAAGMDDYVSKPVDPDILMQRLEEVEKECIDPVGTNRVEEAGFAVRAFDLASALSRTRDKKELLKRLVRIFLQELPPTLANIRASVITGDNAEMERSVHRLKGAASTISAQPLADIAARLEQLATTSGSPNIDEAFGELQARAAELVSELELFIAGEAG
ncbi:response regulator [Nitrosospira sp. Is2]|uniref:response regulator n=1 Tax=Nitrosospira sp. Is2 TaxID=3080532 RepID=UPI002955B20E|nr:response regulator [Nitrosospira sp. Is2]WON75132.1 response regulator [Nitrosospira sp. Is2]